MWRLLEPWMLGLDSQEYPFIGHQEGRAPAEYGFFCPLFTLWLGWTALPWGLERGGGAPLIPGQAHIGLHGDLGANCSALVHCLYINRLSKPAVGFQFARGPRDLFIAQAKF